MSRSKTIIEFIHYTITIFLFCIFISNSFDKKEEGQSPVSTVVEHERIDSLELTIVKIDSSISKVKHSKVENKKKYEESIIYINSLEYDSLYRLFTSYYPEEEPN